MKSRVIFLSFILLHFCFSLEAQDCLDGSFKVEYKSDVTFQKHVVCMKKISGKYVKHGEEKIYGEDLKLVSTTFYIDGERSDKKSFPKLENKTKDNSNKNKEKTKYPSNQNVDDENYFYSKDFFISINKEYDWYFLDKTTELELINKSDNTIQNKKAMKSIQLNAIVSIVKEIGYVTGEKNSIIPRITIYKDFDNNNISLSEVCLKYRIRFFSNMKKVDKDCIETTFKKNKVVRFNFYYPYSLKSTLRHGTIILLYAKILFLKHKGKNFVIVTQSEAEEKYKKYSHTAHFPSLEKILKSLKLH